MKILIKCSAARDSSGHSSSPIPVSPSSNIPPFSHNVPTTIGFVTIDTQIHRGAEISLDSKELGYESHLDAGLGQSSQEDLLFEDRKQRPLEKKLQMLVSQELGTPDSPMTDSGPFTDTGISSLDNTGADSKLKSKRLNLELLEPTTDTDMDYSELSPSPQGPEALPSLSPIQSEKSLSEPTSTSVVTKAEAAATEKVGIEKTDAVLSPILFHDNKATSPMSLKGQIQDLKETKDASSSPPQFATQSASTSPPKKGDLEPRRGSTEATTPNDGPSQSLPDDSLEFHMELKSETEDLPVVDKSSSETVKTKLLNKGILKVLLVKGKDLQKKDKFSKSDPYATIQIEDTTHKTKTVKNNHSPEWNHEFDIKVDSNESAIVHIEVFNKKTFGKDDSLGVADIEVGKLLDAGELWIDLQNCKSGQIMVSSTYKKESIDIVDEKKTVSKKVTKEEAAIKDSAVIEIIGEVEDIQDKPVIEEKKAEEVNQSMKEKAFDSIEKDEDSTVEQFKDSQFENVGNSTVGKVETQAKAGVKQTKELLTETEESIAKEKAIAKSEEASGLQKEIQVAKAALKGESAQTSDSKITIEETRENILVQSSSHDEAIVNVSVIGAYHAESITLTDDARPEEVIKHGYDEAVSPSEQLLDKALGEIFDSSNQVVSFEVETNLCNVEKKGKIISEMTQKIESNKTHDNKEEKVLIQIKDIELKESSEKAKSQDDNTEKEIIATLDKENVELEKEFITSSVSKIEDSSTMKIDEQVDGKCIINNTKDKVTSNIDGAIKFSEDGIKQVNEQDNVLEVQDIQVKENMDSTHKFVLKSEILHSESHTQSKNQELTERSIVIDETSKSSKGKSNSL